MLLNRHCQWTTVKIFFLEIFFFFFGKIPQNFFLLITPIVTDRIISEHIESHKYWIHAADEEKFMKLLWPFEFLEKEEFEKF